MRQRLAFAIAAQLDADIYLCDEVLAVGDEKFQQKCLQQFSKWQQQGKTIVLVSHNTAQISQFCDQAIWLDRGEIAAQGTAQSVVGAYLGHLYRQNQPDFSDSPLRLTDISFSTTQGPLIAQNSVKTGENLIIRLHYQADHPIKNPVFGLALHRHDGTHITGPNTQTSAFEIPELAGQGILECHFSNLQLLSGTYLISASIFDSTCTQPFDYLDKRFSFTVEANHVNQYGLIDLFPKWNLAINPQERNSPN
jgi:hypothetical protein